MSSFFKVTAPNADALYFWGEAGAAERYVDWLNRAREINLYSADAIPEGEWDACEDRTDVLSGDEPHWDRFMVEEGA